LLKEAPELEKLYPDIVRVKDGELKESEAQTLQNLSPALQAQRTALETLLDGLNQDVGTLLPVPRSWCCVRCA